MAFAIDTEKVNHSSKDLTEIVSKTVLLKVKYGRLGNTRNVAGASVLSTDADVSLLKVSKTLLESDELEKIRKHDSILRKWLNNTALPYKDIGILMVPVGVVPEVQQRLTEHAAERKDLVAKFVAAYPGLVEASKESLGSLAVASEYPPVDLVSSYFTFEWDYLTFGVPLNLKDINPELFEAEAAKAQKQIQAVGEDITIMMRENLLEAVMHLKSKLTPDGEGKMPILRESAIQNIQEFISTFDMRNITSDTELEEQVAKLRGLIEGQSAKTLKSSDKFKADLLKGVESIGEALDGLVYQSTGRKFRDEEEPVAA